jgi:dolichyl-diphosphooligosaccharide--protein glycosyltransferase
MLRLRVFGLSFILLSIIVACLYPTGYFGPISLHVVKHTKTGNLLMDSMADPDQVGSC